MFDIGHGSAEGGPIAWPTRDLSKFDDFDRVVLAGLALKSALLRTGLVRLYSSEPHRRATLGARWMYDVLRVRNGFKLAHGDLNCRPERERSL